MPVIILRGKILLFIFKEISSARSLDFPKITQPGGGRSGSRTGI